MPNVLFLDDDPIRTTKFRRVHPYATTVETAAECVDKLKAQDWDIVCLDHDLGGQQYVDPSLPNTGSGVVRWIEANKPEVKLFYVHSFNSGCAGQMIRALHNAGYHCRYAPFGIEMVNAVYETLMDDEESE